MARRTRKSGARGRRRLGPAFWLLVVVPACLLLAAAVVNWIVMPIVTRQASAFPVPDLSGLTRERAAEALNALGLLLGDVNTVSDSSVPPGHVVSQIPQPGRLVKPGRRIGLDVSRGADQTIVPDLAGRPLSDIEAALSHARLKLAEVESLRTADFPAGRIIAVRPPPGSEVPVGSAIVVAESMPVGRFPMPNLLGMDLQTATGIIASQGLVLGAAREAPSEEPAGIVLIQYPEEGMSVADGDTVHLIVATPQPGTR